VHTTTPIYERRCPVFQDGALKENTNIGGVAMDINTLNKVIQWMIAGFLGFMIGYIKGVLDLRKIYKKKAVKRDKTGAIIMKENTDGVYRAK